MQREENQSNISIHEVGNYIADQIAGGNPSTSPQSHYKNMTLNHPKLITRPAKSHPTKFKNTSAAIDAASTSTTAKQITSGTISLGLKTIRNRRKRTCVIQDRSLLTTPNHLRHFTTTNKKNLSPTNY
jgi:hypothetical protein